MDPSLVRRLCDVLAHRGPDDEGTTSRAASALGHRRLAHHRPGRRRTSRWATRTAPSGSSSTARSTTSSELRARAGGARATASRRAATPRSIVHAYEQYGDECVRPAARHVRLRALGRAAATLFLARDRVGKKPLFYAEADGAVRRSPPSCRRCSQHPGCPRELDPAALDDYLTYGYVPAPRSLPGCQQAARRPLLTLGSSDGRRADGSRALLGAAITAEARARPRRTRSTELARAARPRPSGCG